MGCWGSPVHPLAADLPVRPPVQEVSHVHVLGKHVDPGTDLTGTYGDAIVIDSNPHRAARVVKWTKGGGDHFS